MRGRDAAFAILVGWLGLIVALFVLSTVLPGRR